jgi:hypothetical protein
LRRWIPRLGPTKKRFMVAGSNTQLRRRHRFSSTELSSIRNSG